MAPEHVMPSESDRRGICDEGVSAVGHAAQGINALKRRKKGSPYYFRGAVEIAPSIDAAVSEALDTLGFTSTAQKNQLCIFADGSFDRQTYNGGYAVAYNGFSLGRENRHVAKGWTAIRIKDNHTCEGLAIAQSLREAIKELTILEEHVAARQVEAAGARDPVETSVKIFSDSQTVLKATKTGKFLKKMKHTGHAIITLSEELREKFRGPKSKLKVNLVVHWIPGHHGSFPLHQVADKLSRKCGQDKQPLLFMNEAYVRYDGTDGVHEEVQAAKQHKERRLLQWRERGQEERKEASGALAHDDLQLQQITDEESQAFQLPQQSGPHTQQPASQQPYQQEWYDQVQTYYHQYAGYWEQLSRWQDWQRAHGHQAGQWVWSRGANQWVWQWDNHGPGETGNAQPPS